MLVVVVQVVVVVFAVVVSMAVVVVVVLLVREHICSYADMWADMAICHSTPLGSTS